MTVLCSLRVLSASKPHPCHKFNKCSKDKSALCFLSGFGEHSQDEVYVTGVRRSSLVSQKFQHEHRLLLQARGEYAFLGVGVLQGQLLVAGGRGVPQGLLLHDGRKGVLGWVVV